MFIGLIKFVMDDDVKGNRLVGVIDGWWGLVIVLSVG